MEHVRDLLWSMWAELGVASAVPRRHSDEYIDPEALILFTAVRSDLDPRLRDESIDWVIRYGAYVSKARLKNLLDTWKVHDSTRFARYSATVNEHAGLRWPAAGRPIPFRPRARALLEDVTRPALISLRARAILGVSARAELVRAFLATDTFATGAELAIETNYTKRNVLNALEMLRSAGVVERMRIGNADRFRLIKRDEVVALVAPIPERFRPWNHLFGSILRLLDVLEHGGETKVERALAARRFAQQEGDMAQRAGLHVPTLPTGTGATHALLEWGTETLASLARTR